MTPYKDQILARDFFTVEIIWLKTIYIFFFSELGARPFYFAGITLNPNQLSGTQQAIQLIWKLRELDSPLRFLIHDNDTKFFQSFDTVFESEGFHIIHNHFQTPNANAHVERCIRTVTEECLDHILILNAVHLRRILLEFTDYYKLSRPHQSTVQRTLMPYKTSMNTGLIQRRKVLGGIINDYYRSSDCFVLPP
jgi:putative transposase